MPAPKIPSGVEEEDRTEDRPPRPPAQTGNLINDVGIYGGLHQPYRNEDTIGLELKSVQAAVNLAKQVNITDNVNHLAIRDVFPDMDFRDGNGNAISGRAWRQPWSGTYESVETDVLMYKINRDTEYHNKVYVFWGLRYVNTGVAHEQGVVDATSITWKDASNTYDIWQTEGMDVHKEMYAFKPILVKNYVDFNIYVRPKVLSSGQYDNFQFLGKIVEPAGNTVMGSPSQVIY